MNYKIVHCEGVLEENFLDDIGIEFENIQSEQDFEQAVAVLRFLQDLFKQRNS